MEEVLVKYYRLVGGEEIYSFKDIVDGNTPTVVKMEDGKACHEDDSALFVYKGTIIKSDGKYYLVKDYLCDGQTQLLLLTPLTYEFLLKYYASMGIK